MTNTLMNPLINSLMNSQHIPGVYREDVFSQPDPGLLTGVPVFLGLGSKGNINQPQRLTLVTQLTTFESAHSYLPDAVNGFFSNGGTLCYVVRLDANVAPEVSLMQGLEAIASLNSIDLVCVPDLMRLSRDSEQIVRMQTAILEHCAALGDRFAILDAMESTAIESVQNQQQQLSRLESAHYGAIYFPWVQVQSGMMPPCGHVAGVYARSDRTGVHQTPANLRLEEVVDLSLNLSDREQALLNPVHQVAGINCLRSLPGRGIRIWGGRTLSQDSNWQYVGVRRLFLTVHRWVDRFLTEAAFEPNDFKLWVRIERELIDFCESLFRQGALQGRTPEEAFYIKCNDETNPPEAREAGQVITEIGLAPTVPSEFIVVRLIHNSAA
jgi:uncharacterized protein